MTTPTYTMTISRMTVDKLGVKLYDRVSAVIAELVANGYDADAECVTVEAPMGMYLASTNQGVVQDSGYKVIVSDDGVGMEPDVVNKFYLKVGGERRKDPKRGDKTDKFKRRVMGRKGVGKLAPFGICKVIEVITAGGKVVDGLDENGDAAKGYRVAHFIMDRDEIMTDEDSDYEPKKGSRDGTVISESGTKLVMSNFIRRQVPTLQTFSRQLSQRFGVRSNDWSIRLIDSQKTKGATDSDIVVGQFEIDTMANTLIKFEGPSTSSKELSKKSGFKTIGPDGNPIDVVPAGFEYTRDLLTKKR